MFGQINSDGSRIRQTEAFFPLVGEKDVETECRLFKKKLSENEKMDPPDGMDNELGGKIFIQM